MDLMKERFTKLLLGEDMSGGGKGVSSALAISNAITNLAGTLIYPSILFLASLSISGSSNQYHHFLIQG